MKAGKIKIFSCGGTIDKIYFDAKGQYHTGEPQITSILCESNVFLEYRVESLLMKDSLDMDDKDRELIRTSIIETPETQIVITHGTDRMIETGRFLTGIPEKTIVMTGAIEPARFKISDAPFNVGFAFAAAQTLPPGVYIAMNGMLFDPMNTVKNIARSRFEKIK